LSVGPVLGEGGFGKVYWGHLRGRAVAVKHLLAVQPGDTLVFAELNALSQIRSRYVLAFEGENFNPCDLL